MRIEPTKTKSLQGKGISTTSQVEIKGFDPSTIRYLDDLLKRYSYGKDLGFLLDPAREFKVVFYGGKKPSLELQNYMHHNTDQGVCGEIAHSFGLQALKNLDIKAKYDIVIVCGSVKDVFLSGHAFLLIAPKELNIRKVLNQQKDEFPEGSLLIDPSLGVIENTSWLNQEEGIYKLDSSIPFAEAQDFGSTWMLRLKRGINPLVIGFLKDYIPIPATKNDNRLLYLAFILDKGNKISSITLIAHDLKKREIELIDLERFLNNPMQVGNLKRLLDKVRNDLRCPAK